jgi:hypothetical protein
MVRLTLPGVKPLNVTRYDYYNALFIEPLRKTDHMLSSRAGRRYGQILAVGKDIWRITSC